MVGAGKITAWVNQVNKEYGLEDKDSYTVEFFKTIEPISEVIDGGYYYIWCLIAPDMWGEKYLSVVSWYIMPEHRNVATFKKVQDEIIKLAKRKKVGYIIQGSHLNDKLHRVLGKMGYRVASMRRDI